MLSYKVISNRTLTKDTFVLRTERPSSTIVAGQCFSVGLDRLGINREYSMYSAAEDDYVDFLIRKVEGGSLSTALSILVKGDMVELGGPYGEFRINPEYSRTKKFVFIATGTGIAPFHSFCRSFPEIDYEILHGIRFENEKYDQNSYDKHRYKAFVSRPNRGGRGDYVTSEMFERKLDPDELYYLCGNRNMITDCTSLLREKGIYGDSIFTETFF
jgi:ferredoxin--NADP+ reductase